MKDPRINLHSTPKILGTTLYVRYTRTSFYISILNSIKSSHIRIVVISYIFRTFKQNAYFLVIKSDDFVSSAYMTIRITIYGNGFRLYPRASNCVQMTRRCPRSALNSLYAKTNYICARMRCHRQHSQNQCLRLGSATKPN